MDNNGPPREGLGVGEPKTPPRPTTNLQPPTPIVPKSATSQPYTSTHAERQENMSIMWQEISRKILGPMPPARFLEMFLPEAKNSKPAFNKEALDKMMNVKGEIQMYKLFINAFQGCCPTLPLIDCHNTPFHDFENREIKPDICLYADRFVHLQSPSTKQNAKSVELMGEFKYSAADDPFDDESPGFERNTSQGRDTLGQICTYATAHAAAQFRTHLFSLLVFPRYARLLLWDRGGVIVTGKINLEQNASILIDFFCRYEHMSRAHRGYDETIQETSAIAEVVQAIPDALSMLGANVDLRFYLVSFPDNRKFLISASHYMGIGSPTGRSTRTFKALCMKTRKIVFLKDTWRVLSPRLLPEHEIYGKLAEAKVPHVATLEAHNDVEGHVTKTSELQWEPWVKFEGNRRFRKFQHYRLVLQEYARPIQLFRNIRELIQAFCDALEAHRNAHDKAKILHRDISAGNIMITDSGRGLLVDWDLSKFLIANAVLDSPPERTGTWQFMAARLIINSNSGVPYPTPDRHDDLESFWHVLLWVALRRCEHEMELDGIIDSLRSLFDHMYIDASGQSKGGINKKSELGSQAVLREMRLGSKVLGNILEAVAKVLFSRYPGSNDEEDGVIKVESMWQAVQSENLHLQEQLEMALVYRIFKDRTLERARLLWEDRRTLQDAQWMEKILETALNDPTTDWDAGSANISRSFPRTLSQQRNRKRESEINNFDDSTKRQKLSDLEPLAE